MDERLSAYKNPLEWLALLSVILGGIVAGKVAVAALHDPPRLQALMVAALFLPFLLLFRWQSLVLFVPVWIVFEALVRRYIVNDVAIFFIKDAILLVAYFKTFGARWIRGQPAIRHTPVNFLLAALFVWSVIEVFNPQRYNFLVGILGIRVSFWYVPLMFLFGEVFATKESLFRFLKKYVLLSPFVAAFGFAQWLAGPESILAKTYLDFDAYYATEAGIVIFRAMGTFASNGPFAEYLLFITLFTIVCSKVNTPAGRLSRNQKLLIAAGVVVGIIATAQAALGALVPLVLVASWFGSGAKRGLAGIVAISLILAIVTVVLWASTPVMGAVWARVMMAGDPALLFERIVQHLFEPIPRALGDALMGHGTGSQGTGLQYLLGTREARSLAKVEGGYSKLAWELGILGLAFVVALHTVLLVWAMRIRRALRDPDLRWVAFSGIMAQICTLSWYLITNSLDHSTYAILFWSLAGIVSALPRLDRQARASSG